MPSPEMVDRVETMLESGACTIRGQSAKKFDITIPYAVLVEPDGSARRVVVAETGCAESRPMWSHRLGDGPRGRFPADPRGEGALVASELNFNLQ